MLAKIAAADSASTVIKKYSVFIYSEAEPHAKYAIYKHTRKFRVLQYCKMYKYESPHWSLSPNDITLRQDSRPLEWPGLYKYGNVVSHNLSIVFIHLRYSIAPTRITMLPALCQDLTNSA